MFVNGLKDDKFDVIISIDVMEHILDDKKVFNHFNELLNNKGIAIISVPIHNYYWSGMDEIAGHVRRYTIKELKSKVGDSGFIISKFYTFGFPFGVLYHLIKGFLKKYISIPEEGAMSKIKQRRFFTFLIISLRYLLKVNFPFFGHQAIVVAIKK